MNKEQQELLNEAYENYLNNFIEPICPPNLDVQPDYYEPMNKEFFIKSAKEKGLRGEAFSRNWGLKIEERELSLEERKKLYEDEFTPGIEITNDNWLNSKLTTRNIPTKLVTMKYNDKTIESYE
jgi:hypothetical protein